MTDDDAMAIALEEARAALKHGDVPIGAVVVHNGKVVARRHNERELTGDPTAHAEVLALRDAAAAVGDGWRLIDATLYATLEPCTMCAGAALHARVAKVVYAAADMRAGAIMSLMGVGSDPRLNHEFAVVPGIRAEEASTLLSGFFDDARNGDAPERGVHTAE